MHQYIATREVGLSRLTDFIPRMGKRYQSGRNHDLGAGRHSAVSMLSPYLRRRLILEEEAAAVAIAAHGLRGAEKFVQEVFWRTYFKGWLERRPAIWRDYVEGLEDDLHLIAAQPRLADAVDTALDGRTGIACFDSWAEELVTTGYLHNHARMWFASIWIFTLGLPWRVGADFFYRHLLDGDPASNTCSWRWVAGLHTPGKAYAATAWNIKKFTDGRFAPEPGELMEDPVPLDEGPLPSPGPLRPLIPRDLARPALHLITEEDCAAEIGGLSAGFGPVTARATLAASHLRSSKGAAPGVAAFETAALADAALRFGGVDAALVAGDPADLLALAERYGATEIVTPTVPVGPLRDWFDRAAPSLAEAGLSLVEVRREIDTLVWPKAGAGFFKVKKALPEIVERLGLDTHGSVA